MQQCQAVMNTLCAHIFQCMYVCMHTLMYDYMYLCIYVCMYACIDVWLYVCVYVYMYACMHWCMIICMYVCMYVCMYACMYACMWVHMYVCTYVYMFVYNYSWFTKFGKPDSDLKYCNMHSMKKWNSPHKYCFIQTYKLNAQPLFVTLLKCMHIPVDDPTLHFKYMCKDIFIPLM